MSFVRGTASAIDLNKKSVLVNDQDTGSRDVNYDYFYDSFKRARGVSLDRAASTCSAPR